MSASRKRKWYLGLLWKQRFGSMPKRRCPPTIVPGNQEMITELVCNTDAAWNAGSLKCGLGWVLSSGYNSSVFTATDSCDLVSSALEAETKAMKAALIYTIDMGCDNITVRSGSQSLVRLINSDEIHIDIDMLLEDIRDLATSFHLENLEADKLAKEALVVFERDVFEL